MDVDMLPLPCAPGNMMLFNKDGVIQKFASPEAILQEFFDLRLTYYAKRRAALLKVQHCGSEGTVAGCPARSLSLQG
jgi:DNA topoisomerase-2